MNAKNVFWFWLRLIVLPGIGLLVNKALAADWDFPPIVHLLATDPAAAEGNGDTATFTVFRIGPTNTALTVQYAWGGTASNGADYATLSGSVTIPEGAWFAPITISPIDDSLVEGTESVIIGLVQPLVWPPPYLVFWPSVGAAFIEDNDLPPTNHPPVVRLVNPPDGSVFTAPVDIKLVAAASDLDGRVVSVEFFDGTNSLGVVSNRPPIVRPVAVADASLEMEAELDPDVFPDLDAVPDLNVIPPTIFRLLWEDVPPGPHTLTAVATDNRGASSRSESVQIRVLEAPPQPIVNVRATDPVATEPDPTGPRLDTATFTIGRSGSTDFPLTVYYRLGGTASNGVDYAELPNSVTIPIGSRTADVVIEPLDDNLVEGPESVVLAIVPPICIDIFPPPPDCYLVGRYHTARAVINDNDPANKPPVVQIVRPLDGSVFLAPADIGIVAQARDFDGRVVTVEFFEGTNSLGIVTNRPDILTSNAPEFAIKWTNVPPGSYLLTAEATDNDGASSRSRPVEIKVVDRTIPPIVSIVATDAEAAEVASGAPDTATFVVSRTGATDRSLLVFYSVSGTASNGVDYNFLSGRITIPAGAASSNIVIVPIDDRLVEGLETVNVRIEPPICLAVFPAPPDCYLVGSNNLARAIIRDNDISPSNQPPKVAIVRPQDGDIFLAPADIVIYAEAKDADGFVRTVEFFAGTNSLGVVSNSLSAINIGDSSGGTVEQLFRLAWNDVPAGGYVLTAKATDNKGAMSTSDPVRIKVIANHPIPVVTIEATDPYASEGDLLLTPIAVESADGSVSVSAIRPFPNTATFTVKRDRGTNIPLTVYYNLGGTAENGVDYRQLDGKVTIPQGAWTARIVVDPIDDKLVEGTETVIASLQPIACPKVLPTPPECYLVGDPARAIAYIRDNDFSNEPPKVEIVSPENGQVFVSPTDIEIDVLTLDPDGYVTEVEFFEGTNSLGKDIRVFIVAPPPGQVQKFSLVWSNVPPGRYELTARAKDDGGAISVSDPIVIKVLRGCVLPVVTIEATDKVASEQSPLILIPPDVARFRVSRSCGTNADLRVQYSIGGTASNGVDYTKLPGFVVIPAGSLSAEIVISPIDDNLVEGTETVVLALEKPDCLSVDPIPINCYVVGDPSRDIAYIRDNDQPPNQPPKVSIVSPPDGSVFLAPVDIRIAAAAADSDGWVASVEFFANDKSLGVVSNRLRDIDPVRLDNTSGPIAVDPVPINPFVLVWSNVPPGDYVLTALATDNDGASTKSDPVQIKVTEALPLPIVTVEATDPKASEGPLDPTIDPVPNTATFTIKRRGPTNDSLTVYYRLGGTASNGVDYILLRNHVTISAGSSSADVIIDPIDDNLVEGPETVVLALVEPPCLDALSPLPTGDCYQLGRNRIARAIIYDNDSPPNQPPGVRIVKPEDGEIFLAPADIRISAAAFDLDGRVVSVEFFEGTNSLGIVLQPLPSTDPTRQLFELTWSNVVGGEYVLSAVATDDDGAFTQSEPVEIKVVERTLPPVVCIAATDPEAREVNPSTDQPLDPAVFTVTRSGETNRPLTVFYRVGGTAENSIDYKFLRGYVTIPAGASFADIVVDVIDDLKCEGDESVIIGLLPPICVAAFPPPDCYTICANSRARAIIHDNDICPTNIPPRVAIVRPEDGDIFFAPADIAIYAEAKDPDGYIRSVEFFAGNRSLCVVSNTLPNIDTLFRCKWENVPVGSYVLFARATDNSGASTISDPVRIRVIDEPSRTIVFIRATDEVGSEPDPRTDQLPDPAVFTVTRIGRTNSNLTVYYRLSGTASNGVDYRRLDGSIVIPAGSYDARIVVDPIDDDLVEGTETVVATLVPPVCIAIYPPPPDCYSVGRCYQATVYIRDNDSAPNLPPRVAILIPSEGETFQAPADVQITAVALDPDGWVTEVFFYEGTNQIGGLAILVQDPPPPGQLQTFTIDWNGVPVGNYTLTAKAVDNRGAETLSGPIHIRVIDPCRIPVVTIAATDPVGSEEGPDPANFRVRRSCGLDRPLLVHYRVGGTASNGIDYWPLSGMVLMQAGQSSADIPIRPIDDNLVEGTETVVIELVQPPCLNSDPVPDDCYLVGREDRAVAYIRDNDFANQPPRIAIVRPRSGDLFRAGADIPIVAQTLDPDGYVGRVEFFANGISIGVQEIYFFVAPPPGQLQTFSMIWSNVPAGQYALTAKATDSGGATTLSGPVRIGVVSTNPLPVVTIFATDPVAREGTTNTATFRIRRSGGTNEALTVYYSIRGTASNGVDYVQIPDKAVIPAGRRGVRIVITPIDDRRPEPIETVILRLEDSLLYDVGRPARAAAIILDNDCLLPGPIRLASDSVHLLLTGAPNLCYRLEGSTNLRDWEEIDELLVGDDGARFIDAEADEFGARFFRLTPMFEVEFYDDE